MAEEIWNRPDARRQSAILPEEPSPVRPYNAMGPGSPRPPTMIERHLNSTPPVLSRQPTLPNMFPNRNGYGAIDYSQPSFSPGDIVSPTSVNPFISPYAQDVMRSPVSSNVPDYHDMSHPTSPVSPPPALTRQPSSGISQVAMVSQNSIDAGLHKTVVSSPNAADPHYVNLSRSSMTLSQAAQYAEITEKLGTPMPSVLGAIPEVPQGGASNNQTLSPPADFPSRDEKAPTGSSFVDPRTEQQVVDVSHDLDTEVPLPTPILFEHTRIPSIPPTLPEIRVPERSFSPVASFELPVPLSARESPSPFSTEFSDLRTPPPAGLKFRSSPLAVPTPQPVQTTVKTQEPKTKAEPAKRPDSVYTIYDEDDAYGGI